MKYNSRSSARLKIFLFVFSLAEFLLLDFTLHCIAGAAGATLGGEDHPASRGGGADLLQPAEPAQVTAVTSLDIYLCIT